MVKQIMLLKQQKTPNYRIAQTLGISLSAVERYVTKFGLQLPVSPVGDEQTSKLKAMILGYLHGEGYKYSKVETTYYDYIRSGGDYVRVKKEYKKPRNRIYVDFYNTNLEIINLMLGALQRVYGCQVKYSPKKHVVVLKSRRAVKDILSYGDIGCYVWRVPHEILMGPKEIQKWYIRAFGDAEASVDTKERYRIRFNSNNSIGLKQIQHMLNFTFDIPSKLRGPYTKKRYYLEISRKCWVLRYYKEIGFSHPEKNSKLMYKFSNVSPSSMQTA